MRIRFAILLCTLCVAASGCDEISARRKVQEANDLYKDGKYEDARKLYQEAVKTAPDLAIAHHNLGVTDYKLMRGGDTTPEGMALADEAATELTIYLKSTDDPKEKILIQKLVTEIWVESNQVDKALGFWDSEHQARPQDTDVLEQLASLNNKKGDWRKAIEWLHTWVDTAPDDDGKAAAYQKIGNLCFLRMLSNKGTVVGAERVELSDIGTAALEKALEIQPKNMQLISTLASMNQQRALAEGSRIAFHVDLANHQNYMRVFNVLRQEQKQAPPAAPAAGSGDGS